MLGLGSLGPDFLPNIYLPLCFVPKSCLKESSNISSVLHVTCTGCGLPRATGIAAVTTSPGQGDHFIFQNASAQASPPLRLALSGLPVANG